MIKHVYDKRPTNNICVYSRSFYGIVECGIYITCTRTHDSKINVFHLFVKRIDGLLNLFQVGDVCFSRNGLGWIFLIQFVKQMCSSANNADSIVLICIFLEKSFTYT